MAQYITMKQVPGGTVTAVDDRIVYDMNLTSGRIYGCEVSYQGNNMIHINAGYGVIKGGLFEMEDHTEYVEYAEDEPTTGQIYLKFDAAATDKLIIVCETANELHPMEQNEDANFEDGVYEIQVCTFTATTTALEDVTETWVDAMGSAQADWNQTDPTKSDYIKNKPTVPPGQTRLTQTLVAGQTSVTFTDESITSDSYVDIYVEHADVVPINVDDSTNGRIIVEFNAQSYDIGVRLIVS